MTDPIVTIVPLEEAGLLPDPDNARQHNPRNIGVIEDSMQTDGVGRSIFVDQNNVTVAGAGALEAAQQAGIKRAAIIETDGDTLVVVKRTLTPEQRTRLALADNRATDLSTFDADVLKRLQADAPEALAGLWTDKELVQFFAHAGRTAHEGQTEADALPAQRETSIVAGDVFALGLHRLVCGDSTNIFDVSMAVDGFGGISLLHADPPYGMGKEAAGVTNDNLYGDKLNAFQMAWWTAIREHLRPNASAYVWGNPAELWSLWYERLGPSEPMTLRNEIVWNKKTIAGMASPDMLQYPIVTERCLFFTLGRFAFLVGQTKDDYWPGWEPIRAYLAGERDRMKLTSGRCKELVKNNMYGHWFGTSQWCLIAREHYETLAAASNGVAFQRPYADLHAEYEQALAVFKGEVRDPARDAFDAGRAYFDNAHTVMHDVWEFPRVTGDERFGHATTPKPVEMIERILISSSRSDESVFEPFGGTGSTLIAAERTGRRCATIEIEPGYCQVIIDRWEAFTGEKAVKL